MVRNKAEHVQTSKPRANALKPIDLKPMIVNKEMLIQPPKFKLESNCNTIIPEMTHKQARLKWNHFIKCWHS